MLLMCSESTGIRSQIEDSERVVVESLPVNGTSEVVASEEKPKRVVKSSIAERVWRCE